MRTAEPRPHQQPSSDVPRLADGLELIGEFEGSGLKEAPLIARRADGQIVQLHPVLYAIAAAIDGRRSIPELAAHVSERLDRELAPDDLAYVLEEKLQPLGVVASPGEPVAAARGLDPLLALKLKTAVVPERAVNAITTVFRPLFLPPVVLVALGALAVLDYWLFVHHGIAQPVRAILLDPLLLLMVLGLVVLSAAFHECGHAAATRYGGARPGAMGVGVYIVWPAFYTDITDSYRLGRAGRLRADLGGVYFNVVFILATAGAYFATGFEPLLVMIPLQHVEIIHQFLPFLRLDGYYIISDLTGVPDMFSRVKPVLRSLLPGGPHDPRVEELKTWARAVVTAWVVILVPVIALMFGLMAITAPRLIATAWSSLGGQWTTMRHAWHGGAYPRLTLAVVQCGALILPVAGLIATFWRLAARLAHAFWGRTSVHPLARAAGLATAALAAAFLGFTLWPQHQYVAIQPGERGTLASAASALQKATRSNPTGAASAPRSDNTKSVDSQSAGSTNNQAGSSTGTSQQGTTGDGTTTGGTTTGGTTTDVGSSAPPQVTGLSADTSTGEVVLAWTLPQTSAVDGVVVRRGDDGSCPASATSGTSIGSSSPRTSEVDRAAVPGTSYCYAVFTISRAAVASSPATVTATLPQTSGTSTETTTTTTTTSGTTASTSPTG
jgi:putative peptide zinc metalloprotease protein